MMEKFYIKVVLFSPSAQVTHRSRAAVVEEKSGGDTAWEIDSNVHQLRSRTDLSAGK